ncbi:transposase [Microvirga sp. BT689]|uniref:transposase n=1 Tax=Microvirga arvi TaxID=2778731 RepID=UPI00194FDA0F|nr:transposase [Microvirga arvi]MBM6583837.1 transposase [Microvirga arvi]
MWAGRARASADRRHRGLEPCGLLHALRLAGRARNSGSARTCFLPLGRSRVGSTVPDRPGPSERYACVRGHRHKLLTDWAGQMLIQVTRWPPEHRAIVVADMSYATIELLQAVRRHLTVITRLRLDARLFDPPPARQPRQKGQPRVSGARRPTLAQRLNNPRTR